jgi:hypothetical protein
MQIILIIKLKRKDMKKLLFIFIILFITSSANAGQKYIWTDEDGQTHVSETEPENWGTQNYEETKESKQTEIKRVSEEAIKETQLKAAEERKSKLPTKRKKG